MRMNESKRFLAFTSSRFLVWFHDKRTLCLFAFDQSTCSPSHFIFQQSMGPRWAVDKQCRPHLCRHLLYVRGDNLINESVRFRYGYVLCVPRISSNSFLVTPRHFFYSFSLVLAFSFYLPSLFVFMECLLVLKWSVHFRAEYRKMTDVNWSEKENELIRG